MAFYRMIVCVYISMIKPSLQSVEYDKACKYMADTLCIFLIYCKRIFKVYCYDGIMYLFLQMSHQGPQIVENNDGTLNINYKPTERGAHELSLTYNEQTVDGNAFNNSLRTNSMLPTIDRYVVVIHNKSTQRVQTSARTCNNK